jgi:hypothetical protein
VNASSQDNSSFNTLSRSTTCLLLLEVYQSLLAVYLMALSCDYLDADVNCRILGMILLGILSESNCSSFISLIAYSVSYQLSSKLSKMTTTF